MAKADVGVDDYIAKQASEAQPALRRVRGIIRKLLPKAEETKPRQIKVQAGQGQQTQGGRR